MKPTTADVNTVLREIETADLPDSHPRRLAQKAIAKWKSDAEQRQLPVVNLHDDKGAPLLDRDEVLRRSYPDCVGLR